MTLVLLSGLSNEPVHISDAHESDYDLAARVVEMLGRRASRHEKSHHQPVLRLRLLLIVALAVLVAMALPSAAHDWFVGDPPLLSLGTGAAEIFDSHQELFWNIEYRPAFRFYHFGPWMSFGTGNNHEFYAAVGVLLNIEIGRDWILTPSFGGGYYNASSGLDLGFDAEFRSGIELSKRFPSGHRFGLNFAHLSNGSLSDKNPGTESLGIVYSIPLDFLFRSRATATP